MLRDLLAPIWKIPKGKVATYGGVARAAGYPRHARQVAWALRAAHGAIPWHRVVGAGGKLLMPGEYGFEQRLRLEAEGVKFAGLRVRMELHRHAWFKRKPARKTARRKPV